MISEAKIVFSEEFRRAIRRRGWLVVTAIVPIALIVAWILVPLLNRGEDKPPHPIGFVDLSGELVDVSVPDSLANRLPELVRFPSREAGLAALTSDTLEIEHVFVVAEGFLETGKVDWLSTKSGIFAGESNRNAFDGFLTVSLIADRLDPQLATRVLTPNVYTRINVGQDGTQSDEDEAAKFLLPVFLSMLLLISIMMGSSTLLQIVS